MWKLLFALAAALAWAGAAPAGDPEVPEKFLKVAEAKAALDQKKRLLFVDVRPKEQYDELHIRGAVSIPLQEVARRVQEVPRQGTVVLY